MVVKRTPPVDVESFASRRRRGRHDWHVRASGPLSILALGDDAYGRSVLQDAQQRLGRGVAAGAVYATLDRLEAKGMVRSTLAPGTPRRDGRVRRYYAVTASGIRALNESKRATERMWRGLAWPVKGRA